jgi:NitT/TauT family transport system substrate-binding protein
MEAPTDEMPSMKSTVAATACLAGAAIIAVALVVPRLTPHRPGAPGDTVTLGVSPGYYSLPILVAQEQGFFDAQGLATTIRQYPTGTEGLIALRAGDVDVATASDFGFTAASLAAGGDELRILASLATFEGQEIVARRDRGIASPADLRGKRVGVQGGSPLDFGLERHLVLQLIDPGDLTIVDLSYDDCLEAITKGSVDATILFDQRLYEAKQRLGANAAAWPSNSSQDLYWLLVGRADKIAARPETTKRLLAALLEAQAYARAHPVDADATLARTWSRAPASVQYGRDTTRFSIELDQSLIVAIEDEADWLIRRGGTDTATPPNYLRLIYRDALDAVDPYVDTIIG